MRQRLREMLASGLVAVAVLIIVWFVLRRVVSIALWLVNIGLIVAVVFLLFAAARRLRNPKKPPRF
ncbi:MAG: hypothetical protein GY720_19610 [bacterium]|nr:hypothetical protein [bacterium]